MLICMAALLVCWGCYNKALQTGRLKQQTWIVSVLEEKNPESRCQQDWSLPRTVREDLVQASLLSLLPVFLCLCSICLCPTVSFS